MWSEECGVRSEITALRRCLNIPQIHALNYSHSSLLTPLSSKYYFSGMRSKMLTSWNIFPSYSWVKNFTSATTMVPSANG